MSETSDWSRVRRTGAVLCWLRKRTERWRGAKEPVPSHVKPVWRSISNPDHQCSHNEAQNKEEDTPEFSNRQRRCSRWMIGIVLLAILPPLPPRSAPPPPAQHSRYLVYSASMYTLSQSSSLK